MIYRVGLIVDFAVDPAQVPDVDHSYALFARAVYQRACKDGLEPDQQHLRDESKTQIGNLRHFRFSLPIRIESDSFSNAHLKAKNWLRGVAAAEARDGLKVCRVETITCVSNATELR